MRRGITLSAMPWVNASRLTPACTRAFSGRNKHGEKPMPRDPESVRMLSTSGILGYGFPEASLDLGMRRGVDMLGVDGQYGPGAPLSRLR